MSAARKPREAGPLEQLEGLQRELDAGQPLARGYLVRGEEGHFRELALRALAEAAERAGLELARHDAGDPDFRPGDLCSDLSSASMFAPARCVVVRRANRLVQHEEGEAAGSAAAEAAIAFLRRKAEPGMLLLEASSLRVDSVLAKALREAGGSVLTLRKLYASPPPWERGGDLRRTELVQWLLARARARGLELRPDDAVFIVAATGNELAALEEKLERVQHRGAASLREAVPWTAGSSPFEIADWLVAGDAARSLAGLEALFRAGFQGKEGRETNEAALVAMLFGSLRNRISAILAALEGQPPSKDAAEHLPARSPAGWRAFARELARLERRSRTGPGVDVDRLFAFALRTRRAAPARSAR